MPTVPAAGYPTGPEAPPAVPLDVPGGDYQRIQATPEAFGAQVGQSMSALGRVLTTSADEFAQVARERQDLHNNVVSDKAINDFNDKANNLLYGDPNAPPGSAEAKGYYGLRGQDAIDAYPKMRDALQTSREQMRGQLENPMQQLNFDKETRRQMSLEMGRAGSHYDQQYDVFQTQTNKASAELADQQLAQYVGNDEQFNAAIGRKMDAEYKQLQAAGLDKNPESVWAMQGRIRSQAIDTELKVYAGRNDTTNALRILNEESGPGGALSPADAARWRTLLSDANVSTAVTRAKSPGGGGGGGGGAARATDLVPYTPSSDTLSGTGLNADQYQIFRSHVAARESGSYAQQPNAGGYMGRYQMGSSEIKDTANRLGVPVPTQQQFLSDPALQERFFENYTLDHHNSLMAESEQYRNAPPAEKAAILMGAHLGGVKGVQNYLAGRGDAADSNGTRVSDYVTSMRRAMAGGTTPAAPGAAPPSPGASIPPQAQVFPSSGKISVWGDSIGKDLQAKLGVSGTNVVSAQPPAIRAAIEKEPPGSWVGQTVVLSSGSNGQHMDDVEATIKYLQDHNANVVVVGYGTDTKASLPQKNAQLREMAGRLKVPVIDLEDPISDGVHPGTSGVNKMTAKIQSLHTQFSASTPAPQTATVPEGQIIYGPNGQQMKNVGGKLVDVTPRTPPPEM